MVNRILSVCMHGRNDNYGGNFCYHLSLTLNYLAFNLASLGCLDAVEVLITDWDSPDPLSGSLELTPEACRITRFVEVDAQTAGRHNFNGTSYHTSMAQNVSLRRATGEYVFITSADILFAIPALERLLDLLKGNAASDFSPCEACMGVTRKFIPNTFALPRSLNEFAAIDGYIRENDQKLVTGRLLPGLFSGLGALVMPREMCDALRGFHEGLGGWGYQDIELGLRVSRHYATVNISHLGIYMYDFEPSEAFKQVKARRMNDMPQVTDCPNDAGWGLGLYDLPLVAAKPGRLFSRRAGREEAKVFLPLEVGEQTTALDVVSEVCAGSRYATVAEFFAHETGFGQRAAKHGNSCAIHLVLPEEDGIVFGMKASIETSTELDDMGHKGEVRFYPGIHAWRKRAPATRYEIILLHARDGRQATGEVYLEVAGQLVPGGVMLVSGGACLKEVFQGVPGFAVSELKGELWAVRASSDSKGGRDA